MLEISVNWYQVVKQQKGNTMWNTKIFKSKDAMTEWLVRNDSKVQWVEIFVNNAYGVEYRKRHVINFD